MLNLESEKQRFLEELATSRSETARTEPRIHQQRKRRSL